MKISIHGKSNRRVNILIKNLTRILRIHSGNQNIRMVIIISHPIIKTVIIIKNLRIGLKMDRNNSLLNIYTRYPYTVYLL